MIICNTVMAERKTPQIMNIGITNKKLVLIEEISLQTHSQNYYFGENVIIKTVFLTFLIYDIIIIWYMSQTITCVLYKQPKL